ncbi:MAG: hypothetical protein PHF63_00905 [Herbinix sp.]|nr:hypothetical protein [Herbinix sp.]
MNTTFAGAIITVVCILPLLACIYLANRVNTLKTELKEITENRDYLRFEHFYSIPQDKTFNKDFIMSTDYKAFKFNNTFIYVSDEREIIAVRTNQTDFYVEPSLLTIFGTDYHIIFHNIKTNRYDMIEKIQNLSCKSYANSTVLQNSEAIQILKTIDSHFKLTEGLDCNIHDYFNPVIGEESYMFISSDYKIQIEIRKGENDSPSVIHIWSVFIS